MEQHFKYAKHFLQLCWRGIHFRQFSTPIQQAMGLAPAIKPDQCFEAPPSRGQIEKTLQTQRF
jgi:hypothetical protein